MWSGNGVVTQLHKTLSVSVCLSVSPSGLNSSLPEEGSVTLQINHSPDDLASPHTAWPSRWATVCGRPTIYCIVQGGLNTPPQDQRSADVDCQMFLGPTEICAKKLKKLRTKNANFARILRNVKSGISTLYFA